MANNKWIVTMSGDILLTDVQKQLTETGFTIDQVLDQIGCITGSAPDDVAELLRKIPGVADVSPDTSIDLGPPGESVTW